MEPTSRPTMNAMARSATMLALLGFQDHTLGRDNLGGDGSHVDSEVGDFPVLRAVYLDLCPIVLSDTIPFSQSAVHALENCRRTQEKLVQVLRSMGFTQRKKHSDRMLDRVQYFVRRYFSKQKLDQAKLNYRNSVFLLRDITMDAVTHHRLENLRHDVDSLCGEWDKFKTQPATPTISATNRVGASCHEIDKDWVIWNQGMFRVEATAYMPSRTEKAAGTANAGSGPKEICVKVLFDTGSDKNIVGRTFLQTHDIPEEAIRKLPRAITFNGVGDMKTTVKEDVSLDWHWDGVTRTNEFYIVEEHTDKSFDILLGWEFIQANELLAIRKRNQSSRSGTPRMRFVSHLPGDVTAQDLKKEVTARQNELIHEPIDPKVADFLSRKKKATRRSKPGSIATTIGSHGSPGESSVRTFPSPQIPQYGDASGSPTSTAITTPAPTPKIS